MTSTVSREIAAAYRAGRDSWKSAAPGEADPNPYAGTDTPRERVLAAVWMRGRLAGVDPAFRDVEPPNEGDSTS